MTIEMLDSEYDRMATAESQMWWYRSLHEHLLRKIQARHGANKDIRILDAGCGTGGFLRFLRDSGYSNLVGIDVSSIAVDYCQQQAFDITRISISDPQLYSRLGQFDVIVSIDVICSLPNEEERIRFFRGAYEGLKPGGMVVVQTPAFRIMGGIHDIAVGVNQRYSKREMRELLKTADLDQPQLAYRLTLMSIPIFFVRLIQRTRLKLNRDTPIESDVVMPSRVINTLLLNWQRFEDRWLPINLFGSSLQITLCKR